jgi:hypothetical protein
MKDATTPWTMKLTVLTLAVTVVLTGCATIRQSKARATERVLAAAGFKMHPAVTPEQQQRLEVMPPYRLVLYSKAGALEYVYADPTTCKCMYEGGPNEYSAYQRLASELRIEREQLSAEYDMLGAWDFWPW